MPLLITFTKFEQSHEGGYCSGNEEFENRIVTRKKMINIISEDELEKLGIPDGQKIKLKNEIIQKRYEDIVSKLEECDYGTGYCGAKNVLIDIIKIEAVYDDYNSYKRDDIFHEKYPSNYNRKIRRIKFGDDNSDEDNSHEDK